MIMITQLLINAVWFYRCDCGFFATSQIEDSYFGDQMAIPLYSTYTEFDPYTCTWPEGGFNPCKDFCRDWADQLVADGFNLCTRTPDVSVFLMFFIWYWDILKYNKKERI